jgi:hypothetical protein
VNNSELEHFGIKGMRWGVRRKSVKPSGDAATVDRLGKKLKTGGTKALTNKELKKVVDRMNLEKQYKNLAPDSPSKKASKFVADMLLTAGKAEVSKLVLSQAAKQSAKLLAGLR